MVKKKIIYVLAVLVILLVINTILYFYLAGLEKRKTAWQALEVKIKKELNTFHGQAGIIIKDLNYNWQIGINQEELFPSASLVKIPIMAACFYAIDQGRLRLEEKLSLKGKDKALGSGILKDTSVGTDFSIRELIELMISESDNTATNMLIDCLGFDYLNNCFKRLRLKSTNISRRMMDLKSRREGKENFTTAVDLANILEDIYRQRLINRTSSQMCLEFLKKQKIRDRIPARLPPDTKVAHKTGLENSICHDAGIVFGPKGNFLICVLTKHNNKTAKSAKEFISRIALEVYNCY
jgi:beta-lactamase class A